MLTSPSGAPIVTLPIAAFAVMLLTFPLWAEAIGLYHYLGIEIAIFILYALGYNLLLGYTGLPAFGHGAFLGVGAYSYGLWQLGAYPNVLAGLSVAVMSAAVAAGVVALFLSHRRGIYFALMTIAFGQVFWFLAMRLRWITGGEDGLLNILRPTLEFGFASVSLRSNVVVHYLVAVILVIVMLLLWRVVHSPFGTGIPAGAPVSMDRAKCKRSRKGPRPRLTPSTASSTRLSQESWKPLPTPPKSTPTTPSMSERKMS